MMLFFKMTDMNNSINNNLSLEMNNFMNFRIFDQLNRWILIHMFNNNRFTDEYKNYLKTLKINDLKI